MPGTILSAFTFVIAVNPGSNCAWELLSSPHFIDEKLRLRKVK